MIKLKNILTEESAMKAIINAKKGAKASGGGYSSWTKIGNNSWKNKKTGRLSHNAGLYDKIGEFSDFVIEGKLTEDFSQRARNFRVILRQRMKDLKKGGKILAYKMTFTKVGDNKFNWNGKQLWDTEAVVRKIKLAAVKDIMGWKQGARGAPMVKAFLTIKEGKLNDGKLNEEPNKAKLIEVCKCVSEEKAEKLLKIILDYEKISDIIVKSEIVAHE